MAVPTYAIGQRLTADVMNTLASYLPVTYTKAATTARNSGGTGTTYTNDPELTSIPLAVGTYEIELTLFFILTTTATQKLKTNWSFTGTWNNPVRNCMGPGTANTAVPGSVTDVNYGGYTCTGQDAIYDVAAGGAFVCVREVVRNAIVTVTGNLALSWAQQAASANNTSVCAGTSYTIRKQ